MSKLRVALVASFPLPGQKIDGGVQAVSATIAEGLQREPNIDLTVFTFQAGQRREIIDPNGIRIIVLPRRQRFNNLTFYRTDLALLRAELGRLQPDIVHAQDASIEGYIGLRSGFPAVITFHGMLSEDARYLPTFKHRLRHRLISLITERYCVRAEAHKILISPYVADYYGKRLKGVTRHISNPIGPEFYDIEPAPRTGRILYAGKIIRRKGILDLVKALVSLGPEYPFQLVLAGSPDDAAYVNEIRTVARAGKIENRLTFLGLIDRPTLSAEFSRADMLVLPSYQETAPMVIQQAMAARLPVIATRICGVPYQLDEGRLGLLFEPGDVPTLASHIRKLLVDREFRGSLLQAAYDKASAQYHASRVVEQTISFYREALTYANSN